MGIGVIGGGGGALTRGKTTLSPSIFPVTSIQDGGIVTSRVRVPNDKDLYLWSLGVQDFAGNTFTDLTISVIDESTATTVQSTNEKNIRSEDNLGVVEGPADVRVEIENQTGGTVNAGGEYLVTVEDKD